MALPTVTIPDATESVSITLPGGASIQTIPTLKVGSSPADPIQPALTPLMPLFEILGVISTIFNILKAIIDALGPPPDPTKILALADLVPGLSEKMARLAALLPQVSLPLTVIGLIDFILNILRQLQKQLKALEDQAANLDAVSAKAEELGDTELENVAAASRQNINQEVKNLGITLGSTNSLLAILNIFLGILGLPTVPDFSSLSGLPIDALSAPIDSIIATLESVRESVPIPS